MISNHMQLDGIPPTSQMSKKDFTAILPMRLAARLSLIWALEDS